MGGRMEPWRECADWLTRCGVLRSDHKANWAEAEVVDLALTLRDGVLLCNLLNVIEPGCIDTKDVNQKPRMAQACHDVFNLKESDLFEALGLFDLTDFVRVLQTLSKLSTCPKFQRKNIPGFSLLKHRTLSQDDMYRNLSSSRMTCDPVALTGQVEEEYSSHHVHMRNEEIYQDLCSISRISCPQIPSALPASLEKRDYVINELVETERNYLDVLGGLQRSFMRPLVSIISEEDYKIIFFCIKELYELHLGFLNLLRKAVVPNSRTRLSEVFLSWREKFLIYGDYIANLTNAQNLIQDLCNRSDLISNEVEFVLSCKGILDQFQRHCDADRCRLMPSIPVHIPQLRIVPLPQVSEESCDCAWHAGYLNEERSKRGRYSLLARNLNTQRCQQEANNGKFKLRDILSVPMQRILKYHLLLDKLVSETQMNHDDYRGLERAKEAMVDVAQYINEVKRDSDTLAILKDIEMSISDWHMPPDVTLKDYGRLIIDGELRIKAHNDQKQKVRYVFVFDTVMVMCKAVKGDQYSYKESLRLEEYKIQDIERKILTRDARWSYQWYLVHRAERTAYTCYSRTEEFKKKWMNAISEALDNIEPSGCRNTEHKFRMFTFDKPTTCSHCSKFLKGKIYQGYQCERCHINSHKACIPHCGRCGPTRHLPVLPPRLPPAFNTPRSATPTGGPSPLPQSAASNYDELNNYLWFVGEMGRERATNLLENELDGTYLLRIRPQGPTNPSETVFALSLKTNEKVKHMKVYEDHVEGTTSYYLSISRFFKSIIELVTYYQHISLEENFVGLDVKLQWPYRRIVAVAEFDFNPTEPNQLPLRSGCQVVVLSKEGDSKGWWKGKIHNREGFFPKQYVREVTDNLSVFASDLLQ